MAVHLAVTDYVCDSVFFVLSFFPRDVLDEILDLTESVFGVFLLTLIRFGRVMSSRDENRKSQK